MGQRLVGQRLVVLTHFGQVEAGQGGVTGGHSGHPQGHHVAQAQDLAQHGAGVGHLLLVGHRGLPALPHHGVDLLLHSLYGEKKKLRMSLFIDFF